MTFKDLKQGDNVFIINKNKAEVILGKVNSITPSLGLQPGQQIGIYKDVNIAVGEINKVYTVNEAWTTAYADNNNTIITPNTDCALNEIRGIKKHCEDIVGNIEVYKENAAKCDKLLAELDPSFKKEQAYEKRLAALESMVKSQADTNNDIKNLLNQILNKK